MASNLKPVLRYPGAKWVMAPWIISHFPTHKTYIEPFFGSGAVFFTKSPSEYEVINDKAGAVVNLFKMIRDYGHELASLVEFTPFSRDEYEQSYEMIGSELEDARRFLVRCWQAHGARPGSRTGWKNRGSHKESSVAALWNQLPDRIEAIIPRLKSVEIENRPALDVIRRFADDPDVLMYLDPPYVLSTRSNRKIYIEEMGMSEQVQLLAAIQDVRGAVVLSGYDYETYDTYLPNWCKQSLQVQAEHAQTRKEVLWLNERAAMRQMKLF